MRELHDIFRKALGGGGADDVTTLDISSMLEPIKNDSAPAQQKPQAEMRSGPPAAFPNHLWWEEKFGLRQPWAYERMGRLQTALGSAVDAIGFGVPGALTRRYAPETASEIDQVRNQYPMERGAGTVAGAVASPLNRLLRWGGDTVAARGGGRVAQALADGAVTGGAMTVPGALEGKFDIREAAALPPIAMMARVLAPALPSTRLGSAAMGATAGAMVEAPQFISPNRDSASQLAAGAGLGAVYGVASKGRRGMSHSDVDNAVNKAAFAGAVPLPFLLYGLFGGESTEQPRNRLLDLYP